MKKIVEGSALLQMIIELATYGYRLFDDWRSGVDGRSIQELLILFRARQARWEAFDFTDRRRVSHGGIEHRLQNGVLGVTISNQDRRFYKPFHPSFKSGDDHPWIKHYTPLSDPTYCWDEGQDLLILSSTR